MTVRGHHDQVLDPRPAATRQVDPGLDRDHVAGLQPGLGGPREPRRLVDIEPDAVAEAVAEVIAMPGGGDQVAGDRVDLAALETRPDRRERRLLRVQHGRIEL